MTTSPLRDPHTGRFEKKQTGWQLGKNRARIPGGLGFDLPEPVMVCGIPWVPADGDAWASPIGAALAYEIAEKAS